MLETAYFNQYGQPEVIRGGSILEIAEQLPSGWKQRLRVFDTDGRVRGFVTSQREWSEIIERGAR